jgi:cell division protein FtsW
MITRVTDQTLLKVILAMVFLGMLLVMSASWPQDEYQVYRSAAAPSENMGPWGFLTSVIPTHATAFKHLFMVCVGLSCFWLCKRSDYKNWRNPRIVIPLMGMMTLLALAASLYGKKKRWLELPGFQLQPSELCKPALILFLAWFLCRRLRHINSRSTLLPIALVVVSLCGIIGILGKDLGTALVLGLTAFVVLFAAGLDRRIVAGLVLLGALGFAGAIVMEEYRLARVIQYLGLPPEKVLAVIRPSALQDPQFLQKMKTRSEGTAYQGLQSALAIGSGGLLGRGLMQSRQKMKFLPESHNDYIFGVVGEEMGLIGSISIVAGFFFIFLRGVFVYEHAPDDFGRLLALGVTVCFVCQAMINMMVATNMLPSKGIPLPMISYGGTSTIATLLSFGMLMSVSDCTQSRKV